jgi:2-keto-4-pentenoate hydratase/2-oxohepta-3-ene-1,7-dioic acid hydratase in catechol pathway
MKLGTVFHADVEKPVAVIDAHRLLDLRAAGLMLRDMVELVEAGEDGLDAVRTALADPGGRAVIALTDVQMRCPIRPVQYRDCLVFEEHLVNSFAQAEKMTGRAFAIPPVWYEQPIYYKGNRMSFIGAEQDVIWPSYAEHLDVELEMAIIIGKGGKDIAAAEAPGHIWGYTILNDVSARDAQMREMPGQLGPAKGKDFDTGNILGPWIVTADEIAHPTALDMELRVNGDRWGGGNSRAMHHSFARIIEHISASETLYAGEVIGSGTVGTGCGLETGRRLAPGDVFELEIEGIGVLRNRIVRP